MVLNKDVTELELRSARIEIVDGTVWVAASGGYDVWSESFRHADVLSVARRSSTDESFVRGDWIFLPKLLELRPWVHDDQAKRIHAAAQEDNLDDLEQLIVGLDQWTVTLAQEDWPVEVVIDGVVVGQVGGGHPEGKRLMHRVGLGVPLRAYGHLIWRAARRRRITPGVRFGAPRRPGRPDH